MIVKKLLPIKAHFFFFMAALGPILPQLQVFGKQLGISSVIMGTVTGILPFAYLLAKPLFGMIVDVYRDYRKSIFMGLIMAMGISYGCVIFIPIRSLEVYDIEVRGLVNKCDNIEFNVPFMEVECSSECSIQDNKYKVYSAQNSTTNTICSIDQAIEIKNTSCEFNCKEFSELPDEVLFQSFIFWVFVAVLSIGTIAFNVVNSISDAVCFDVIGEEYDYGKQRTWGAIGYGVTALLSGYIMDLHVYDVGDYKPAIYIMLIFVILDLLSCLKLKLPVIPAPKNIWSDLRDLMKYNSICIFLLFTVIAGAADGFLTYFLLWYVEDIAEVSGTANVKLLEGFIIAAETFGGEILFFYVGDNILKTLGHVNCFSVCFLCYAFRLGFISIVSTPWSIVIVEFLLQGPSYALTYLTIVAYANEIAPAGTSATMQGIAAGLDDGLGYAIGSLFGGILYRFMGPRQTFQIFGALSATAGIAHYVIHKQWLQKTKLAVTAEEEVMNVST